MFWFCPEKHTEDNGIPVWRQPRPPHQEKAPKQGFSAWRCLFRPYARQPTGNARNARLLLDRRPCSTYWLLVGKATGTMSKMSSHTIGTRHLWLCGHGKNERFTLRTLMVSYSHWHTGRDAALGRRCSHFWAVSERLKKRSPLNPTRLSHLGWFKWPVITFLSHCLSTGIPVLWCF